MITSSEQLNELATALANAQAEMQNATKDSLNPHFRNKYADLAAVREAVLPHLTKYGIAVLQLTDSSKDGALVHTRFVHKSGQWIQDSCFLPVSKADAQGYGSAITYARRYGLAAMAGIAADEDDDGNAASGKSAPAQAKSSTNSPKAGEQTKKVELAAKPAANTDKPLSNLDKVKGQLEALVANFDKDTWLRLKPEAMKLPPAEKDEIRELYNKLTGMANKAA